MKCQNNAHIFENFIKRHASRPLDYLWNVDKRSCILFSAVWFDDLMYMMFGVHETERLQLLQMPNKEL